MGHLQASEFANAVKDGTTSLDAALEWHLRANHYPPIPLSMVGPCKRAIKAGNRGDWNHNVRLPKGVTWQGKTFAPASAIIEAHHLDAFLESDEDEGEYLDESDEG